MRSRAAFIAAILILGPAPVGAEVMDKELAVADIWGHVAAALVVAGVLALVQRWLLILSFLVSLVSGVGFAWTEWHDPFVGPAIASEAGPSYGFHVHAAIVLLLVAHFGLWIASSRRLRRKRAGGGPPGQMRLADSWRTLVFSAGLLLITLLEASGGFGEANSIWSSPPVLVAGLGLAVAAGMLIAASRKEPSGVV